VLNDAVFVALNCVEYYARWRINVYLAIWHFGNN